MVWDGCDWVVGVEWSGDKVVSFLGLRWAAGRAGSLVWAYLGEYSGQMRG
jgi:hypothetical protein